MEKGKKCYDKLEVPIDPRNSYIVYNKYQSEYSEKSMLFHNDLGLQNKGNSQDSRDISCDFSEPANFVQRNKRALQLPFIQRFSSGGLQDRINCYRDDL